MSFSGKQQVPITKPSPVVSPSEPPHSTSAVRKDVKPVISGIVPAAAVKEKDTIRPQKTEPIIPVEKKIEPVMTKSPEKLHQSLPSVHISTASAIKSTTTSQGQRKLNEHQPVNVAVPRERAPRPPPDLKVRPLVLASHLVPSLPVGLFELLAEALEASTQLPVSIIYEARNDRPVAKDVADLAILPAYSQWEDGDLLPVTFIFEHRLNDDNSGNVYVDVIVTADRAQYVKDIMDLRGHKCALPDRRQRVGAASLLLGDLRLKGESPAFFGNTLDSGSQIAALQMVAGRQAEVGVVESPVLTCHRRKMPGVSSLLILNSLGPLPPYAIFVKKSMPADLREKITSYLLNLRNDGEWLERFFQYGVVGFTNNSIDAYSIDDAAEEVPTSVRYY